MLETEEVRSNHAECRQIYRQRRSERPIPSTMPSTLSELRPNASENLLILTMVLRSGSAFSAITISSCRKVSPRSLAYALPRVRVRDEQRIVATRRAGFGHKPCRRRSAGERDRGRAHETRKVDAGLGILADRRAGH